MYHNNTFWVIDIVGFLRIMVRTLSHMVVVVRNIELLELIHSDLCEFVGILTRGGNRNIITFIDDFSKYTIVYLLKNKSDAFEKFQYF